MIDPAHMPPVVGETCLVIVAPLSPHPYCGLPATRAYLTTGALSGQLFRMAVCPAHDQ